LGLRENATCAAMPGKRARSNKPGVVIRVFMLREGFDVNDICLIVPLRTTGAKFLLEQIDPAVCRPGRLDRKLFVGPPDYEARVELLRLYLANRPQEAIDWHNCAGELENYTCAEIEFIVNEAARIALSQNRPITNGDILNAAGNNPPALSASDIEKMR
jgi:SpoVK/Ycf46/Vps4 family AAA+-type ATPase